MVLSLMRRHAKSWLIKFLIGIIAVVFIFYFGYSFTARSGVKIAYVNGELISGVEYQKAYRNLLEGLQRQYRDAWSDNLIKLFDIKNRALDTLINQRLISQEAKRVGLDVTEKEIQEKIMAYPGFQFQGQFDERRYMALLQNNRMKPEDFEAAIAQELLHEKVSQFLMTFSPVTEAEVRERYTFYNEAVKVSFVEFMPEKYKDSVKIDEAGLEKYFDEHKDVYRIPEKIKLTYMVVDPNSYKDEVVLRDGEVMAYYEENIEMFREKKKVKARHILFKLDEDASEEKEKEVKEKALAVLGKARAGEDFAALAKAHSEGPTAKEGGDLGYFSEGDMVKPFEEAAFNLKKGEISDLVRTRFGYHIIKVEDVKEARTKSLEEVKDQILENFTSVITADLAHEKALSLIDQMPYDVDLKAYASENEIPAEETDYFAQDERIPKIGGDEKVRQSLFSLERGDVSELMELDGKFYLFQVTDKKPSALPALKEVQDRVKADYTNHLATMEAKSSAEKYLEKLKEGKDWTALSKENGLEAKTTGFFTRQGSIPQIGYDPEITEVAFGLSEDKPYPDKVFDTQKGVYVIRWEGRKGIDKKKFEEEEKTYRQNLALLKQQQVFREWLDNLKSKAEIEILQSFDSGETS
jgi:peptidyl-prolyl cis-trans isomerase D